jgi:2,3-diketo-5-methylthio-1-phosphopentane phosphatase
MSRAPLRPTFDGAPTPVSLLIDFDGTISLQDVGDALLRDLVADQAAVRRMDQLYHEGRKGSRELNAWDMDVLPRDPAALYAVVDALPLDDSFVDLVRVVQDSGAAIEVVSDGVGFHVERMLARLGLHDLPVATNAAVLGRGGDGVTFPYGHPACLVCGTCKRERIRAHQRAGRAVVFVGDGPSDRYAAHHADVIFAKWSLAGWCREQGIAYEPWERLADVAAWFEAALADGRLPADADAFDAWASGVRPEVPTFICGPEIWAEGRTTAIDAR